MKRLLLFLVAFCSYVTLLANFQIKGTIRAEDNQKPVVGAIVSIENTKISTRTDENGKFKLGKIKNYQVNLVITTDEFQTVVKTINLSEKVVNLGDVFLTRLQQNAAVNVNESIQTIVLDDNDATESTEEQNVSSQLGDARDLFRKLTSFSWGAVRYRQRGYINNYTEQYFNGVPFNELDDERVNFNAYSGLNDVTRNPETYIGLTPNNIAFGDLAGSFSIDTRASLDRKTNRISYMSANRNYRHRVMATYSTGLMPNGWAVTLSASHRWANEGYIPGTFLDAYAYFASVDKKINKKHSLNLTVFGAPIKQGRSGPAVQELFDLTGDNFYNPYWGYQEGKKRNARVQTTHSPTAILRHDYLSESKKLKITTAASFQYEKYGQTDIDWFNAADPRPDYYSKLPSNIDDDTLKNKLADFFRANPNSLQIDWTKIYQTNYNSFVNLERVTINGDSTKSIQGKRARYVLFERRSDSREANIYSNINYQLSENQQIVGGISYRYFKGQDYKKLNDLLGADFFIDVDQFAERDFPGQNVGQNDVRYPNRVVNIGDKYGYNYITQVRYAMAWGQYTLNLRQFDFFFSGKLSQMGFWREGLAQNGRFQDNSLGRSEKSNFLNVGTKAGVTYKLNGRNYLHTYAGYLTKAPNSRDAFLSPRIRNELAPNLGSEKIRSVESGYNYRSPNFALQLNGYLTLFDNKIKALSFYSEEDRAFVNYVAKGLSFRHTGVELATEWKATSALTLFAAGTMSQHLFNGRATATSTPDNGRTSIQANANRDTLYLKYFYVPNTPQNAATVGFRYNAKRFWFLNMNFNYFGERYMDINYNRRTRYAITQAPGGKEVPKGSELWEDIIYQEKLGDAYTLNILAGKSIKVKKYFINITAGVDNVLNYQFVMSAFEQWRFDWTGKDPNKFPPKYFNAYGRNYFVMVGLRW